MALDRQSIEKRDFPIGRRGYEPEAVDEHLAALAAEVESLQRSSRRRSTESLAAVASEQVRAIVEAAETSAADIERQADEEASRIRTEAQREADRTRDESLERARSHVGKVAEASALMMQRVDAMESELGALVESLRTGANRLNADLSLLEGNMGELYSAAGASRAGAPASDSERPAAVAAPSAPVDDQDDEDDEPQDPTEAVAPAPIEAPQAPAEDPGDVEGARLIALNMALNGQSRDETERYLADNFDLADRDGLLDEVYASVG